MLFVTTALPHKYGNPHGGELKVPAIIHIEQTVKYITGEHHVS